MMKNVLLIILVLNFCNSKANDTEDVLKLSYKDSSVLRFHITNCFDNHYYCLIYNSYFPFNQIKKEITFYKDTVLLYSICINHPVIVSLFELKNSQLFFRFFSLPKDTLDIYLSIDSTKEIKYKGRTASISNYLTKGSQIISPFPGNEEDISTYDKKIDSTTQLKRNALFEFNKSEKLPNWYIDYETQNIEFEGAFDKISQFNQRLNFYHQYIVRPSDFAEQFRLNFDNPNAKFCDKYERVLCSFCPSKYDTLLQRDKVNDSILFQYTIDNINGVKGYLNKNLSFFLASKISALLATKIMLKQDNLNLYTSKIDALIASLKPQFSDIVIYNQLIDYRNEQVSEIEKATKLVKGNKAPSFYLMSNEEGFVKLTDFKGKYVILNFWATWCAPCIKSIEEKNALFQKYSPKGCALINICLDSDKANWKKIIKDKNFQGTQLICMGNWKNVLSNNYNINGIPHYALIDKNGIVISNKIENITMLEELIENEIR